ncbi:hypothetical protein GCM10022243_00160 [Saccharothrix violaceirubra]
MPVTSGRVAANSRSLRTWSCSAVSLRADTNQGTSAAGMSAASGPCSSTMCALVPLMPNEDTPARRGLPVSGQSIRSVSSRTSPLSQATCGLGSSTCRVFGSTPCRNASTILITLATPAAAWVWPMFDFTDPNHRGSARSAP